MATQKKCLTCNKLFNCKPSNMNKRLTCSMKCRKEWCNNKNKLLPKKCIYCGRKFIPKRKNLTGYCSVKCASYHHTKINAKPYHDKDILYNDFVVEELTAQMIAKKYNTTTGVIMKFLHRHGFDIRLHANTLRIYHTASCWKKRNRWVKIHNPKPYHKNKVIEKHVKDGLTVREIANMYNVTESIIQYRLRQIGIKAKRNQSHNIINIDSEWLQNEYINKKRSVMNIAYELNLDMHTVKQNLIRNNIPIRKHLNTIIYKKNLNNDLSYKESKERNCKWQAIKKKIKKRDERKCQKCFIIKKIHVHHILPKSKYPDFWCNPNNLTLLCKSCHDEVHTGWPKIRKILKEINLT